jgi:hypothetical protein
MPDLSRVFRLRHLVGLACALALPAGASLRITGIIEGNPTEASTTTEALTLYKSIEFYSDTGVSASELMKYALRRFNDSASGSFTTFQLNPGNNPNLFLLDEEFGFAVVQNSAFRDLYFAGGLGGQNWANNTGQTSSPYPRILLEQAGIASTDGNEAYQLLYYPGGFGLTPSHTFQVVDSFGILNDPGASTWTYERAFAYRLNATGPSGSSFNPAEWTFGEAGIFNDDPMDPNDGFDFEGHSSIVPFGTFANVPEPTSLGLVVFGAALLARLRKSR